MSRTEPDVIPEIGLGQLRVVGDNWVSEGADVLDQGGYSEDFEMFEKAVRRGRRMVGIRAGIPDS